LNAESASAKTHFLPRRTNFAKRHFFHSAALTNGIIKRTPTRKSFSPVGGSVVGASEVRTGLRLTRSEFFHI
jgi:hypothetical protein